VLAASCLVALVGNSYLEAAQAAQQPAGGDARVPARIRLARDLLRLLVGDANPGSTSGFSGGTTPHLCARAAQSRLGSCRERGETSDYTIDV
jgi:hypothetical protein